MSKLKTDLEHLRFEMAEAAQKVYDEWAQDEKGDDEELGSGGICDGVAEAIAGVIVSSLQNVETFDGGQEGDDHAWTIAQRDGEAFGVDINQRVYEIGGGYHWKKKPNVIIRPDQVEIFSVPLQEPD
jgi:hypothetical protein